MNSTIDYESINLLNVSLSFDSSSITLIPVGRLATQEKKIWFEYAPDFILLGLSLSPFNLPLQAGAITCDDPIFQGLFGLFDDSLPDGWGRLLLDKKIRSQGIIPEKLSP